jgi:hypothetical protein
VESIERAFVEAYRLRENVPQQRKMMPAFGVDCDLTRDAKQNLIIAHVVGDIDDSHRTTSCRPRFRFNERR